MKQQPQERSPRFTPRTVKEWGAVIPQYLGVALLIFIAVFWAVTRDLNPALLSAALTLLVAGQAAEATQALKKPPPPPEELEEHG